MRTPTMKRPWGESASPRSVKAFRTMAVEDRARVNPKKTARNGGSPNAQATAAMASVVAATWSEPPRMTTRAIRVSLRRENSTPTVNSNSATPTPARVSREWRSRTTPRPEGPAIAPARIRPAIVGRRSRTRMPTRSTATTAMATRSRRRGRWCTLAPTIQYHKPSNLRTCRRIHPGAPGHDGLRCGTDRSAAVWSRTF